jgi:3-phenylpropionate/trans-cinnamate dioxygenase ferredoxin subunit
MRGFTLAKDRHVLVANLGGRFFALDDMCNHAGCLLSAGRLSGGVVTCSCHEMAFDLRDGRLVTEPRLCDDQPVVRVTVERGELWVESGEGAK